MAKHYAISDIHGMYDIYSQVCEMLKPDDVVYFLGDAGDRGYANWRCIKEIYNNPQWIYLKGNHEDMMVKALYELLDGLNNYRGYEDYEIWMWNGGSETEDEFLRDSPDTEPEDRNWMYKWMNNLRNLKLKEEYTNSKGITFHMSHAGFTCGRVDEETWGDNVLWDRGHFLDYWDNNNFEKDISIHGHTPNEYLVEDLNLAGRLISYNTKEPKAIEYCNGHKICIDNGAFYTGTAILYDLDEMIEIPIFDRLFKPNEEE